MVARGFRTASQWLKKTLLLFALTHQFLLQMIEGDELYTRVHKNMPPARSQRHKRGPKQPKYQAPYPEHPDTAQPVATTDIHANHLEAFHTSLRRRCAAYRRRTNMYAKKTGRLQERLDVYWIVHNFVRVHFTTRQVPAVALGILDHGFALHEIFLIPKAA